MKISPGSTLVQKTPEVIFMVRDVCSHSHAGVVSSSAIFTLAGRRGGVARKEGGRSREKERAEEGGRPDSRPGDSAPRKC